MHTRAARAVWVIGREENMTSTKEIAILRVSTTASDQWWPARYLGRRRREWKGWGGGGG